MTHACHHDHDLADYRCALCDSMQELIPDPIHVGILWLKVTHVAGCPFLARVRAARRGTSSEEQLRWVASTAHPAIGPRISRRVAGNADAGHRPP